MVNLRPFHCRITHVTTRTHDPSVLQLGRINQLIDDLINFGSIRREMDGGFGKYPCAFDAGYQLPDNLVNDAPQDDTSAGGIMIQYRALVPTICNGLCISYAVQRRAGDILDSWLATGLRAMKPRTVAAAAIWRAHEETQSVCTLATVGFTPVLELARLADQAGVSATTVRRVIKELTTPPKPGVRVSSDALPPGN